MCGQRAFLTVCVCAFGALFSWRLDFYPWRCSGFSVDSPLTVCVRFGRKVHVSAYGVVGHWVM